MKNRILPVGLFCVLSLLLLGFIFVILTDLKEINKERSVTVLASKDNRNSVNTDTDVKLPENSELTQNDTEQAGTGQSGNISKRLRFIAVGDILLGRTVKERVIRKKERYLYPFLKVSDTLKKGDVIFGNLEESITDSNKTLTGIQQGGKYVLKNDTEAIEGLKYAGFNLLSLANNHILDCYETGLLDTQRILAENNISFAGAGKNLEEARKLSIMEKNGIKIGMLAYTEMADVVYKGDPPLRFLAGTNNSGVAPFKKDYILEDIVKARKEVDFLAVSFHWGIENNFDTTREQIEFAHELIDSGVDMVLGHHPHRTQGVEIYKGKPVFYSLGNFIFDQNDVNNMQGFIMEMEFNNKKLETLSAIPYKILDKCQIVPQTGLEAEKMINREISLSTKLNTKSIKDGNRLIFDLK